MNTITFNKPHLTGREFEYIADAVESKKLSGNGKYTQLCHEFFQSKYGFNKCFLTSSCTDALEMCAILLNVEAGDEVIMPSYTFVSTANAFVLRGAKIVFADSRKDHPGIDEDKIEQLITVKTKVIVVVHYAGVACDMDKIMAIATRHSLFVVEDAAQAIDSYYTGKNGLRRPLGSIGHLSAFSFHETKNIISGEGGMLVVNDDQFSKRAEIIWEKGTNRSAFFKGEVDKYGWVDIGSSFLPSEMVAAFLYAQLEHLEEIQERRTTIWHSYENKLREFAGFNMMSLPTIPDYATNNAHMFYVVFESESQRLIAISEFRKNNIHAVFHYLSLHQSDYYSAKHDGRDLPQTDYYSGCLLRLPFYYDLTEQDIAEIVKILRQSFDGVN